MTRKRFTRITTLVLVVFLAVLSGACGGDNEQAGGQTGVGDSSGKCDELTVLTWEGYVEDQWIAPFEKEHDVRIESTFTGSEDESLAKIVAGGDETYDIISTSSPASTSLMAMGVLKPLDLSKIPNYDQTLEFLRSSFIDKETVYGIPYDWDVNPFLYFASEVPSAPTSWADLWNPEYQGKFAIWDDMGSLYIGAAALGLDDTSEHLVNLTDDELDQVKAKMLELRPRAIWTQGGDIANLLANKEVIASAPGWTYTYNELRRQNPESAADLQAVVFEDHGGFAWSEGYAISDKVAEECVDTAYAFLDWMLDPKVQSDFATFVGYSPAVPAATEHMDEETIKATHMDDPEAWFGGAMIKADPGPLRQKYVQVWQEIKQGLG